MCLPGDFKVEAQHQTRQNAPNCLASRMARACGSAIAEVCGFTDDLARFGTQHPANEWRHDVGTPFVC